MAGLITPPPLREDTLAPRPYQVEAIEKVRSEFRAGRRSTLVVHATGLGKTAVAAKIGRAVVEKGGRLLFLAHRKELLDQAMDTFERVGLTPGLERAEHRARSAFEPDVVCACVPTLQRKRLAEWDPNSFRLLIVDEAHHSTATSYAKIFNHFEGTRRLGLTATADRADEDVLSDVYESIADEKNLWWAMQAPPPGPYLCRLEFVLCPLAIDLRDLSIQGKSDYSDTDLEAIMAPLAETIANAIRQEIGTRQTLVFTPGVASAQAIATALASPELGFRADWVSGDCSDRAERIARYKSGETQILASCAILGEGFDAPQTSAIVLCRPTKSRPLYAQQVGRGTRLAIGKENCRIVDFDYLTQKHELVQPLDLFDSSQTDPEVLAIGNEHLHKSGAAQDLLAVMERARSEQQERQVLRVQAREREVKYRRVSYDPLAAADTLGIVVRGPLSAIYDPPSPKQVAALERFGITGAASMSRRRASRMLDVLITRAREGKATMKQISHMIARGIDPAIARNMSKMEASQELDRIFGRGRSYAPAG